ncbi:MAG TPA: SCO family protein [Candidatus Angelobacter sp.]|jgi:protein SCO1/2|nr:SCO family protein [Candidatus Angelobacter sp.]
MRRNRTAALATITAIFLTAIFITTASKPAAADNARWGANYFPNVILTTQDGTKVRFYDDVLKGKSVVIDLIYTHCVDSCPLETARLAQVQKMLGDRVGKDIFFYSISIDPAHDTPKVLKEYAQKYHIGPGWTFLTGKKSDIDLISKKLGLYSEPDPNDRDGHTPSVLIGNEPGGQWMRNSATDNARFLANMIGNWLDSWRNAKVVDAKTNYSQAPAIDISDNGRYVFTTHCAACHTIGHGDKIGPDLLGVTNVRDHSWLERFILTPDKVIAEKDPIATALYKKYNGVNMPNLRLTDAELHNLIDFLERQSAAHDKDAAGVEKAGTVKADSGQPLQ